MLTRITHPLQRANHRGTKLHPPRSAPTQRRERARALTRRHSRAGTPESSCDRAGKRSAPRYDRGHRACGHARHRSNDSHANSQHTKMDLACFTFKSAIVKCPPAFNTCDVAAAATAAAAHLLTSAPCVTRRRTAASEPTCAAAPLKYAPPQHKHASTREHMRAHTHLHRQRDRIDVRLVHSVGHVQGRLTLCAARR